MNAGKRNKEFAREATRHILEPMALTTVASELTDGALLTRLSTGDKAAWDTIVSRHADIVFSVVKRMVRNPADAEDAGQEAFLRIKEYAHTFDAARAGGNARNWIATIACREALKINARKAAAKNVPYDDDLSGGAGLREGSDKPGTSRVEDQEVHALLREAVQGLPQRQREVIVMHFAAGMTQTEIASELGCDQSTISDRIKQALEKLKHRLSPSGAAMSLAPAVLAASLTSELAPQAFVSALLNHASWAPAAVAAAKAAKAGAGYGATKIAAWLGICVVAAAGTFATVHVMSKPKVQAGNIDENDFQGWAANAGTKLSVVGQHASAGRRALQAELSPGGYPGIKKIFDKPQNWSGYRALRATVFSSAEQPFDLTVRVDDEQSTSFGKRFNGDDACKIVPGVNEVEISIGALWQGSLQARGINPERVTAIHYFANGPKKPVTLWFDNIHMIPARSDVPADVDLLKLQNGMPHIDASTAKIEMAEYKNEPALKWSLTQGQGYPCMQLFTMPDWLSYDELRIEMAIEDKPPNGGLSLKLTDMTGKQQTISTRVSPGETTWAVPVEMFSQIALGRVKTLELFATPNQDAPHTIWVRRIGVKHFNRVDGVSRHEAASPDDPLTLDFTAVRPRLGPNAMSALVWIPLSRGGVRAVRCNAEGNGLSTFSIPGSQLDGRDYQQPIRVWAYYLDHSVTFWNFKSIELNEPPQKLTYDTMAGFTE